MYTALLKVLCYSMVAKAFAQPSSHANSIADSAKASSHAVLPRHPATPSSHANSAKASCHAVLPCCPPMLSCHAVLLSQPVMPTMREGMPINAMNDINIPLPMLYICFSTNYKPFAMLLPLCGLVLLFCCTFFKASFNCASIAPIAELYRSLLCHLSGHHSIANSQWETASPTASPSVRADTCQDLS